MMLVTRQRKTQIVAARMGAERKSPRQVIMKRAEVKSFGKPDEE